MRPWKSQGRDLGSSFMVVHLRSITFGKNTFANAGDSV
jgi:hypothetical protein